MEKSERYKKFYLSPDDKSIKIPALMFFSPEFTNRDGSQLKVCVALKEAEVASCILGQLLKLDWVEVQGVLTNGCGG